MTGLGASVRFLPGFVNYSLLTRVVERLLRVSYWNGSSCRKKAVVWRPVCVALFLNTCVSLFGLPIWRHSCIVANGS